MPAMAAIAIVLVLTFVAWRMYRRGAAAAATDTSPFGLTDCFDERSLVSVPHQKGVRWLTEVFARSAERFPDLTALQVPHTGESLTFAELERRAEEVAGAVAPFLTGPDQVVAVAMSQDNWQIVAAHLGVLKAGGTLMFLDAALPDALISHMLKDARPVVVLTQGGPVPRPANPERHGATGEKSPRAPPDWLDDPTQRLAAIFYTSGTTGMPKGVECPHAGYVNLALSYADYFDLLPGMDATSLTSSLGYDGSISEMYSAWVSGCAVVLLTKEQVRSGPDLVAVLREAEVTVLFCPPVLLTTLTETPEVDLPYPLCRYIVPAGEAFPIALVEPWTRGRRQIINTYGPTEASTDTSRQTLRPGEPVTIGSPFPNVTYVVLEVGAAAPAASRRGRRALHRRRAPRPRIPQPAGANRAEVHHASSARPPLPHRGQMQDRHPNAAGAFPRPDRRAAQGARTPRRGGGRRGHPRDAVRRNRGGRSAIPERRARRIRRRAFGPRRNGLRGRSGAGAVGGPGDGRSCPGNFRRPRSRRGSSSYRNSS